MLSLIVYGRNDNHGYNYHKRLAISLNCLAEVLSFPGDEIVFVDYCSPEEGPTILEAIADTLTEKAHSVLKIYRIRSNKRSSLSGEPLSRNVAIRRTNPKNKWILSTNSDMIFVPVDPKETLSTLVSKLPGAFYQLPRFELPENLWESHFNRQDPTATLLFLQENAQKMQLNTIVRRPGFLTYDNPGDFQLMPRDAIFNIDGFNEAMDKGWHLDANLCKRMSLHYSGKVGLLEGDLWGYHCNHTRQASFFHRQSSPENSWDQFVKKIQRPDLPKQRGTWGLNHQKVEEISLKAPTKPLLFEPPTTHDISIQKDHFNTLTYDSKRVFPYLADHFRHLSKENRCAYIGYNKTLLKLIRTQIPSILTLENGEAIQALYEKSDLIIFDFGFEKAHFNQISITPSDKRYPKLKRELKGIMNAFLGVVRLEKKCQRNIKFIGINTLYTDFRALFERHLAVVRTSFLSNLAYGYLKKRGNPPWKRGLKFSLMYFTVRYFYSHTDKIRYFAFKNPLIKKELQLK